MRIAAYLGFFFTFATFNPVKICRGSVELDSGTIYHYHLLRHTPTRRQTDRSRCLPVHDISSGMPCQAQTRGHGVAG
ncbi:hypothetical protein B0J11DRAFT_535827 [Dendryphion nanum]|uniref:Uncharacterized protein n=1 Tax=Dendryphion nanum TaxID=256645 RepID=A0A9P9DEE7_9PLEO|nr:hypothetical protein B0J11DRAFT_535827 [Dendryphion nanum]